MNKENVTIRHPAFGTLVLHDVEYKNGYVIGDYWNYDTPTGDGIIKEVMNFPISCIKKETAN